MACAIVGLRRLLLETGRLLPQDADESAGGTNQTASQESGASVVGNSVRMSWTQVSSRRQPDRRLRKVTFVELRLQESLG
jgi:hypothetical protein